MTREGWREVVLKAAQDPRMLELLSQLLAEQDAAKARLQQKGYGCIGMPWLKMVEEIPVSTDGDYER